MGLFRSTRFTDWALEQVKTRLPDCGMAPDIALHGLLDALQAVRGGAAAQVFGMDAAKIERRGVKKLEEAIVRGLTSWRRHFAAEDDRPALLELDAVGRAMKLDALLVHERFALLCDPLGDAVSLTAEWKERIELLRAAVAGNRTLNVDAVHLIHDEDGPPPRAEFGAPDADALYRFALRYESASCKPFSRELAAIWSVANGIFFDGGGFLCRVEDWGWDDDGLCIGCGHYCQGSLTIHDVNNDPFGGPVVDTDDDGVEEVRYENLAGLFDALLS
jgi:hypothetical protein